LGERVDRAKSYVRRKRGSHLPVTGGGRGTVSILRILTGDRGCLWYDAGGGWAISKSVQFVCNHAGNYTGARGVLGEPDLYENPVFLAI